MALAPSLCTVQVLLHLVHVSSVSLAPIRRGQVSPQRDNIGACVVLMQFHAALCGICGVCRTVFFVSTICQTMTRPGSMWYLTVTCIQNQPSLSPFVLLFITHRLALPAHFTEVQISRWTIVV